MVKKRDVGVGDVQERIVFVKSCAVGVGKFGKTARYFCRDEEFLSRNVQYFLSSITITLLVRYFLFVKVSCFTHIYPTTNGNRSKSRGPRWP